MSAVAAPRPRPGARADVVSHQIGPAFERTMMGADRTLMAAVRTSLALIGFDFASSRRDTC